MSKRNSHTIVRDKITIQNERVNNRRSDQHAAHRGGREKDDKFLRIGELAEMAGVTGRTIRYYEELGLLKAPERRDTEHRRYAQKDLLYLRRIQQLKSYGLTLSEIKEIIDLAQVDPSGEKRRLKLLTRYSEKWREAMERKRRLDEYIKELEWHIDQLEKVGNFQACPGEECKKCKYTGICKFANLNSKTAL